MLNKLLAVVCGSLLATAGQVSAADVAGNGGFEEEGLEGPTSSAFWNAFASGGPGSLSERSTMTPFAGSYSQHLVANGGDAIGGTAGVTQNTFNSTGPVSLEPGTTAALSFEARGSAGPGGVGFYALRIVNSAGGIVANTGLQVYFPNNNYAHFATAPLTVPALGQAPNDAYYAFVEIVVAAGAFPASTIEAFLDNVVVNATLSAGSSCAADFNGDGGIDGADVEAFFSAWESGDVSADVNGDGGIDGSDVEAFFTVWEAGGC